MTDKQQSEVRATAAALEALDMDGVADFVRRQYAELETLRIGYAAARLEIESLKAQIADHADELTVAHLDGLTRAAQPAGAAAHAQQEPDFWTVCAQYAGGGETGRIPLPGYSNETEHGVKNLVLQAARKEGYKGSVTGRLMELNWEIRPAYLDPCAAPQPSPSAPEAWIDASVELPKSGVIVLACYRNSLGKLRRIRAQWVAAKTQEAHPETDGGEYDEDADAYWTPEGWYECIDNWDEYSSVVCEGKVTHWMPLPPPPAAQEAQ